jgi:hypothetical protein
MLSRDTTKHDGMPTLVARILVASLLGNFVQALMMLNSFRGFIGVLLKDTKNTF